MQEIEILHSIMQCAVRDLNTMLSNCPQYDPVSEYILEYQTETGLYWDDLLALNNHITDYGNMIIILRTAKERFPKNAWVRCMYARALWTHDGYQEALKELNKAIQLNPHEALALALLGETHYLLFNYHEALTALNKALDLDATMLNAISCRAFTQKYLADDQQNGISRELRLFYYTAAIKDFQRVTALAPTKELMYKVDVEEIRKSLAVL